MSFVSEEVREFLQQHPVLELTEGGKVRCTLTGHEVPCTLSAVKSFTEGKKYKRLSSCGSFDYSVYEPHIVPSNKNPKQLFCKLTVRHINRIPEHVQKHVQGKRYQRALAQYVECQKQGLQYVPTCLKNKKKPPRDRADKGPSGKKESWEAMDKESGDSDSGDSMSDLYPDHLFTKTTSAELNGNTKRSGEEEAMEVEESSTQNKRKQEYSIMPHGERKSKRPSGDQQRKAVDKAPGMPSAEEQEVEMSESGGGVETEESESSESDASHSEDAVTKRRVSKEKALQSLSDVSFWEIPVSDHIRVEILKMESASFQNKDGPFGVSQRQGAKAEAKGDVRQLSKDWFYKEMPNGETILRSWMVYSPVSETLYCFCCRLFACSTTSTTSKFVTGFQKWCKLSPEVNNHETSEDHLCCLEKWKTLAAGLKPRKTIDADTIAWMKMEKKTWRDILHKLQPITLFLAERNLSFRDDDDYYYDDEEEDQSPLNKGNFLEMVEMLSNYDPVLKAHIDRLQESTVDPEVSAPYLAPQTQDEFISVLAKHVTEKLAADIKNAKYFGMVFDITPDRSRTYQMSEVIRYVQISDGKVEVKEVFLGLFSFQGKTAADLGSDILNKLESDGLDITMCRSQGYGHSTTMAGIHGGVRSILEEQNQKVIFNGCVDHSLALCGHHSFAANTSCIVSLGTLERIFTFFAASSLRWDVLVNHTGVAVDRLSPTPWSAHYAAVKSLKDNFDDFVEAIEDLAAPDGNMDTRVEADLLLLSVYDFTFLCYLYFWCDVLQEVTLAQQYVQTKGLSLDKVVTKLETLQLFLYEERVHLSDHAVQQALLKSEEYEIDVERKTRVKNMAETSTDAGIPSLEEENRSGMLECIDRFHCELQIRSKAMMEVGGLFESIQSKSLICASDEELKVSIPKLTTFYDEVSESELLLEIPRLRRHLKAANINLDEAKEWATFEVLSFIAEWDFLESLPTLSLSLRLFLTVCVSVASCERSFSKLDVIKNHLRFTMYEPGLPDLAVLSVESEFAKDLNFDEAIDNFAALKAKQAKF